MATDPKDDDIEVKVTDDNDIQVAFEGDGPSTKEAKDTADFDAKALAAKEAAKADHKADTTPATEARIPDDEGIESLRKQLADEKRRREEANKRASDEYRLREVAERRAKDEFERRQQVESDAADTRISMLDNALDAVRQQGDAAERDYSRAMENQDFAAAAKAQRSMANAESKLTQLEAAKADLENNGNRQRPTEGRVTAREEPRRDEIRVPDRVDDLASRLSPSSAAWVRSHPECVTDPVLNSEMIAAHNRAVRNGIPVDSDSYFEFIESRLGMSSTEQSKKTETNANGYRTGENNGDLVGSIVSNRDGEKLAPQPQRRPSVAAPVSRDVVSNSGASTSPKTYTLTRAEREFCDLSDGDNKERYKDYARSKLALIAEGKYDRRH